MGLDTRDLENLAKYFPPTTVGGTPAWAIAGGGATYCLLRADKLVGATRRSNPEDRIHKDLDVYAFHPSGCELPGGLPHEIYRTEFFQKPKRCNYRGRSPNHTGFFIEILHGTFFGYGPPTPAETVYVNIMGYPYWALCPEYVIATRRFHALPERSEDAEDIKLFAKSFELDPAKIRRIIGRGPLAFLLKDPGFDEKVVFSLIFEAVNGAHVRSLAAMEVRRRFPFLADYKLDVEDLPYFLFLDEDMLSASELEFQMSRAHELMQGIHTPYYDKLIDKIAIAVALTIGAGFPDRKDISASAKALIRDSEWFRNYSREHAALRVAIQLYAGMRRLERSKMMSKASLNSIRPKIVDEFCRTAYINVLLSALNGLPDMLSRQQSQAELLAAFEPFGKLIGIRSTGNKIVEIENAGDTEEESV